jgi:hypothetical protein
LDVHVVVVVDITRRRVVANAEHIQVGWGAIDCHVWAIHGNTTHAGGTLPNHLSEVANLVEDIVGDLSHVIITVHEWELGLVPALCDTSGYVENISRDGEKVLSFVGS